jgi:hypothetical protein
MFAALTFDRDPLRWGDLPAGVLYWLQVAGGFAFLGLMVWVVFGLILGLSRLDARARAALPRWQVILFTAALVLSVPLYTLAGLLALLSYLLASTSGGAQAERLRVTLQPILLIAGGAFALLAASLSFFRNLGKMRFRRIFALSKLTFKEAIRRRVLYAFSGLLLVFLFASWYIPSKAEDQVRTYVQVFFITINVLLLVASMLLAAFSIPTDVKQQTIHTIVTKPVERFEVVLGRFFGFLALMTLVLLGVTAVSLLLVLRGVNPDAAEESVKARQPLYGELRFENTEHEGTAVNVGREWDYRRYITKPDPGVEPQTARWDFATVPASLGSRKDVPCEYTFDIYRTTKGKEGAPVSCTFRFYTWRFKRGNDQLYRKLLAEAHGSAGEADKLAEELGFYEINSLPVVDYHTQNFTLPGGLFRNATAADPAHQQALREIGERIPPALRMRVTCDSRTQYVGMARYDLYVRLDEPGRSETVLFSLNFFKAAFGLWLELVLIIAIAIALSTYLSGVISLLVAVTLYFAGVGKEFIKDVALGRNVGGGPGEALLRITRRELHGTSLTESASLPDRMIGQADEFYRLMLRFLLNVFPDVDRYNLTPYVAEGFNISFEQMGMAFLTLVGYLYIPALLAYFLIKGREVASSN